MRPVNISSGRAQEYYYERDPIFNDSGNQSNSIWHGEGADILGLSGVVSKESFGRVLSGQNPETAEQLTFKKDTGKNVAATDIPLSAPKSVSIGAFILEDRALIDLHKDAVLKTADYIEARYAFYRETNNGITQSIKSDNLCFSLFNHSLSRENDPQLHTHLLIQNIVRTENGDFKALDNRQIFYDQRLINAVYQSYLAEGVKALGYEIEHRANGTWEIAGMRQEILDLFSKRSAQIEQKEAELREKGEIKDDGLINKVATLESRQDKQTDITKQMLKDSWQTQLREHGITIEQLKNNLKSEKSIENKNLTAEDYIKTATAQLVERESVLRTSDVLKLSLNLANGETNSVDRTHKTFEELINKGDLSSLGTDARGRELITTKEMLKVEREIIDDINSSKGQWQSAADRDIVKAFIETQEGTQGWQYTDGQRQAIELILSSEDRVNIIQGDAGSGKTESFAAVKEYSDKEGLQIIGIASTGKASKEIADRGITSLTIEAFLSKDPTLTERTILIMDESSMSGSRQIDEVMERAQEAGAKLVFIGDRKQFSSISAGKMFNEMQDKTVVERAELTEVIRAKTDYMKSLYAALNEKNSGDIDTQKNIDKAISILEREGKIIEEPDRGTGLTTVVNAYFEKSATDKTVILTAYNQDRREINELIRGERIERGEISQGYNFQTLEAVNVNPEQARFADAYKEGQIIVAFSDTENLKAGTKTTVVNIDRENNILTVVHNDKTGAEKLSEINTIKDNTNLAVYAEKDTELSKGDRITFLKNDSYLNVENGLTGTVRSITESGEVTVATDTGKTVSFNIEEGGKAYNYMDHAYCLTEVKSQGATYQNVIAFSHADEYSHHSFNSFYVDAPRASHDFTVVTNDIETYKEQASQLELNTSTLSYQADMQNDKAEISYTERATDYSTPENDKSQDEHNVEISH
jgi:conjugative relaxase-like TrwC/TraI family protein